MKSKVFIFAFVLTIFIANSSARDEKCMKIGEPCNENFQCCNRFDGCFLSLTNGVARCGGDGLLGSSCKNPIDCSRVLGGTCADGACVCKSNHKKHNRRRCKPNRLRPGITWHDKK